jgi:hypothetical protein
VTVRRGVIFPLSLIAIGTVFLLANFGLIAPISLAGLLSLWPLLLVIAGIDIALGKRWPLAALGADLLVVVVGVALLTFGSFAPGVLPFVVVGGSNEPGVSTIDVPRADVKTMNLRLAAGAGSFDLRGGGTSLVHADSDRDDLRLRGSTRSGDRIDVRVDQGPATSFRIGPSTASHVTMTLASDIPTSLVVDAGAGEFVIATSEVKLTDARVSVGAASLRVVLPHPAGDVSYTISAGASNIVVEIPDGVEARVTSSGGLISRHDENPRLSGSETSGYAAAKDRVTVRISAGATSITVR